MKKFLITMMCVVMAIAMMPAMAFAEVEASNGLESASIDLVVAEDGFVPVSTYEELLEAFKKDNAKVRMTANITATATQNSGYGKAGVVVKAGDVLDGNGFKLTINGANSTWDCAVNVKGGEVKNLTVGGAFRGIFVGGTSGDIIIDNVHIDNVCYTINVDQANTAYGLHVSNSTLNGWTSYTKAFKEVVFTGCTFGKGTGGYQYEFCRPYQETTFENCIFNEGFELDTKQTGENTIIFNSCTYNGVALSADNNKMFYNGGSVMIDGVATDVTQYAAKIGTQGYDSLSAALVEAAPGATVTLGKDITLSETIYINKNVVINGNGNTITSTVDKAFRINDENGGETTATAVTFKDVTIETSAAKGRCIDTRAKGLKTLTLTNVTLNTTSAQNNQPLTIGGAAGEGEVLDVDMTNCTINAGAAGYGIITFNPVTMDITGSTIEGYAALYLKAESDNTVVNIKNSTAAVGRNEHAGADGDNEFATIVFEDNNATVNVSGSTLSAIAGESSDNQYVASFLASAGNNELNISGNNTITATGATAFFASDMQTGDKITITGGTFTKNGAKEDVTAYLTGYYYQDANGKVYYDEPYIPPVDPTPVTPAPSTPKDDVVTNETTNTGAAGETVVAPTTNANVSASTTTTKTETGEAKTETKVEQTTADKIVENAVANKSEEVVIDATTAPVPTTGTTTTPAEETKAAEVVIPTQTIETIATQTEAAVTIKTDVAEIKLDNTAAAAIAEQAAEDGTISIVAVKTDEKVVEEETVTGETEKVTEVHFELKVICSERGVIGDFKGGEVTVTVPVPEDMHTEELVAVYIDAQGHYHRVTGVKNANGTFTFTTDHFSSYAVMTAEEAEAAIAAQKEAVEDIKFKLSSKLVKRANGKKAVKLTWSDADVEFEGIEIQKSLKKNSGYGKKAYFTTKEGAESYTNTAVKKGTRYYYRARGFVTIDGEVVYTQWSTKAWRKVK